jgi:hypothetical protein
MSWAAIIFVSLATTVAGPAQAPTAPAGDRAGDLPVSLSHIRKALDESASATSANPDAPKLRVDASRLSGYVRPPTSVYDQEFKQLVTPDAVKGCGRLSSHECFQSYANQFLSGLLWQRVLDRKKLAGFSEP